MRAHNARAASPSWWKRSFWSRHEYWANFAAYKADRRARISVRHPRYGRPFWRAVAVRAIEYCSNRFGPVPQPLNVWSPELRGMGRGTWRFKVAKGRAAETISKEKA